MKQWFLILKSNSWYHIISINIYFFLKEGTDEPLTRYTGGANSRPLSTVQWPHWLRSHFHTWNVSLIGYERKYPCVDMYKKLLVEGFCTIHHGISVSMLRLLFRCSLATGGSPVWQLQCLAAPHMWHWHQLWWLTSHHERRDLPTMLALFQVPCTWNL